MARSTGGGARRAVARPTTRVVQWSPDGTAFWVFRPGAPGHRGVDRFDLATGRRTALLDIEELPGLATPAIAALSLADDGRSYAYNVYSYSSFLFTVTDARSIDRLVAALADRYRIERELGAGRHGHGLSRRGPQARPQGRAQGPASPNWPPSSAPSGSCRRSRPRRRCSIRTSCRCSTRAPPTASSST